MFNNVEILRDRASNSGGNDPLLSALVDKLPPAGTAWSAADRQAWLTMISNAFDVVYGVGKGLPVPSKPSAPRGQAATRRKPAAAAKRAPAPKLVPGPAFFIDRQGFARKRGGDRIMPDDVADHIVDLRGEHGDLSRIVWADDSAGIPRGKQLDVTIG